MNEQEKLEKSEKALHIADVISTLNDAEIYAQRRVCEIVSSIYFYGGFKAETHNEKQLAELLSKLGYMYKDENELLAKLKDVKQHHLIAYNGWQLVVSAGLGERNYQLKNKLKWKTKI